MGVAYGVSVECDLTFDELPRAVFDEPAIQIEVHRAPVLPDPAGFLLSTFKAQGRTATVFVPDDRGLMMYVDDSLRFELLIDDKRIICHCCFDVPEQIVGYWILQQILPLFLALAGSFNLLHATAASASIARGEGVEGTDSAISGCISFLGASYTGKSTLLDYFLSRGHELVTDDHLALLGGGLTHVMPAIPFYRPYRGLEDLGILAKHYSPKATPLRRLYVLRPAAVDAPVEAHRLQGADAVAALMIDRQYTIHDIRVPRFMARVEKRFRDLAALSRQVPVVQLHVPRAMDRLPDVYDFIRQDLASERP